MKRTALMHAVVGLLCAATLYACRKTDDNVVMPQKAGISFITPTANQEFGQGETVNISAKITAPEKIHGYDVYILDSNSDTLYTSGDHVHGTEVMVSKTWANVKTSSDDLKLVIVATLNHEGGTISQSITIKCR